MHVLVQNSSAHALPSSRCHDSLGGIKSFTSILILLRKHSHSIHQNLVLGKSSEFQDEFYEVSGFQGMPAARRGLVEDESGVDLRVGLMRTLRKGQLKRTTDVSIGTLRT